MWEKPRNKAKVSNLTKIRYEKKRIWEEKSMKTRTTPSSSEWYHLLGHHLVNTSIMIREMRWEWEWDDYEKFEKVKCKSFLNVFK